MYQTASNSTKFNLPPRKGEGLRAVKTNKLVLLMTFLTFLSTNAYVQSWVQVLRKTHLLTLLIIVTYADSVSTIPSKPRNQ